MKKNKLLTIITIFIILCSNFITIKASAESRYYVTATAGLFVRTGAGTNYSKTGDMLYYNDEVTFLQNAGNGQGCSDSWYKIKYDNNSKEGYVCSTYIKEEQLATIDPNGEYEQYLKSQGFPEDYWQKLKTLHNK